MTLLMRIQTNQRLIESHQAEQIGLRQALIGTPLSREHFKTEHEWQGYERGYEEGTAILQKGEGLA